MTVTAQQLTSFLLAQFAAESYLGGIAGSAPELLPRRLRLGSNNFAFVGDTDTASRDVSLTGYTRMTDAQIAQFVERYDIVDHLPNTITGFSATLLWDKLDNRYVLSFRSTEYPNEDEGGDWRRDGLNGADGEIGNFGFAYAQIADMEAYYQQIVKPLITDPDSGVVRNFFVTGYSLGGHLATVFSEAHQADAGFLQAYTFNAPGRAAIRGDMAALVSKAYQELSAPGVNALLRSGVSGESIYSADNFYTAANGIRATLQAFAGNPSGVNITAEGVAQNLAGGKIAQVFGRADTDDSTWVANSGVHSSNKVELFIEDQPNVQGLGPITVLDGLTGVRSNFGTTHSITLIADALAVMTALQKLAPTLTSEVMKAIFSPASNERGIGFVGSSGRGESDSLERIVEALFPIFEINLAQFLTDNNVPTPDDRLPRGLAGGGFGNWANRNVFYAALDRISTAAGNAANYQIEALADKPVADIIAAAEETSAKGMAYRYALKEGNPFAVIRDEALYAMHNTGVNAGALDLNSTSNSAGALTTAWIQDRMDFLTRLNYYNTQNARYDLTKPSDNPSTLGDATTVQYDSEDIIWDDRTRNVLIRRGNDTGTTAYRAFGSDATESLSGGKNADHLYGSGGTDVVTGKGGADYLEGGTGLDIYEYDSARKTGLFTTSPDGHDTILDVDGKGILRYQYVDAQGNAQSTALAGVAIKDPDGKWQTPDGRFVLEQVGTADLKVNFGAAIDGSMTLRDFDFTKAAQGGYFGIRLVETQALPVTVAPIIVGDYDYLEDPANPNAYLYDLLGNPQMGGGPGGEVLNNVLQDTPQNDRMEGLLASDWLIARRGGNNHVLGGDERDYIEAGAGNDVIEGGADGNRGYLGGNNFSFDVPGGDDLLGGAGDDRIYGSVYKPTADLIRDGATGPVGTERGDVLIGGDGSDLLAGDINGDLLAGGSGDDLLIGGASDDFLLGDVDMTFAGGLLNLSDPQTSRYWNWTINSTVNGTNRQDVYTGFAQLDSNPNDSIFEDAASPGRDVIYGGAGHDVVYAGGNDDVVRGESGEDWLFGQGGSDILLGGADKDVLSGDGAGTPPGLQGDDYLDGGDGGDFLFGDGGNDILIGGAGSDRLQGGDGDDILMGGPGDNDILIGGAGKDTYVFNKGDGIEVIQDVDDLNGTLNDQGKNTNPNKSVITFGDEIDKSQIRFRKGSLMIDLGPSDPNDPLAGNDQIHFTNFNPDFPGRIIPLGEIRFADGTTMNYADILAQGFDIDGTAFDDAGATALIGTSVTDRIRGFAGSDELEGRDGDDVLMGDGGADRLDAGNGDDVLDGGAGGDYLAGGMGSDDYRFVRGDGLDTLTEGSLFVRGLSDLAGTDRIVFGADIARSDVTLLRTGDGHLTIRYGAGDEILVEGQYSVAGSEIESIVFADGQVIAKAELDALEIGVVDGTADADELYGTAGNDVLRGQDGDDYLDGGPIPERRMTGTPLITGEDVLEGGAGGDTYALYWGMGNDRILDNGDGQTNTLALLAGATLDSIKTSREGDDLRVALRGGGGSAAVQGFFSDGGAASWEISSAADGSRSLLDFYIAQSTTDNSYAIDFKEDYKQRLLAEWRSRSEPDFTPPTHVYINSTWTQTISQWERLVDAFPVPVRQTVTIVNHPVEHTSIGGFGVRRGSRIVNLPLFGEALTQRVVAPTVSSTVSDAAFIAAASTPEISSSSRSYTFFAGGGGPFPNPRTYSNQNGFVTNTITESSAEGWAALNLRTDGLGRFRLTTQQILENPVIEEITAGAGDNTIIGMLDSSGDSVALIDAGAGNDTVNAGQYDFALGNEGDDQIVGGAYAFGGSGFDRLSDSRFMAGGADDDFLSGGEGITTFHFRSDEAGWDQVQDRNGISLNEFALRAGFSDSPSNLVYGGKYRLEGEASLQFQLALQARAGGISEFHDFLSTRLTYGEIELSGGDFRRYPIPGQASGFPRGVPDPFFRGPYVGDGFSTWIYNSTEDMMRDFADLGMPFNPAYAQPIPEAADLSAFTADNYQALKPFFDSGVLEKDVLELADFGDDFDALAVGFAPAGDSAERRKLRLVWGEDKVVDIELPDAGDLIGHGVEEIRLGRHSFYIGEMLEWAETSGFIGTPFEDDLMGTAGNDRIRGLAGWDFIEGGAGDDVLSGGAGIDEFFFAAGAGSDIIVDPDAEDLILFDTSVSPDQIRLGLGSLRLGYGSAGEEIHFEGFNPDDVYGATLFGALQFYDTSDWTLLEELSYDQVLSRGFDIDGTAGDDMLRGTNIHDRFTGGAGNDVLSGGAGSDTYFFNAGDGIDTINDFTEAGAINRVVLRDYRETDITGVRQGEYVVLRAGAADSLRILWNETTGSGVDRIEFSDGAVWDRTILAQLPVDAGNAPPVLTHAIADQGAIEDSAFSFAVPADSFADPDAGDTLTYSASLADGSALPDWLDFDVLTHTFSGTPANADVGTVRLAVTARDRSGAAVSAAFELVVENVNDAPVYVPPIGDQTAAEDSLFSFAVPEQRFAEIDAGDNLSYSAGLAGGGALPAWLGFDAVTRTFSGTPGNADVGSMAVAVTATDAAGSSAVGTFAIHVTNTNDAPILTRPLSDRTAAENAVFSFTVPADTFLDIDAGDTLTYSASLADGGALPGWLSFNAANRVLSGTPPDGTAGGLALRITAVDEAGSASFSDFMLAIEDGSAGVTLTGTSASESLTGTAFDDWIDGRGGNDLLYGLGGNDWLIGGSGADRLFGGSGADMLDGRRGHDVLKGGKGADIYLFGRGSGKDVIEDDGAAGEMDAISFGTGITLRDLRFERKGGDLNISITGTQDRLTVRDWASRKDGIELLRFADGRILDLRETVRRSHGQDNRDDSSIDHQYRSDKDDRNGRAAGVPRAEADGSSAGKNNRDKDFERLIDNWFDERRQTGDRLLSWLDESRDGARGIKQSASAIRAGWEASERWIRDHRPDAAGRVDGMDGMDFSGLPWLSRSAPETGSGLIAGHLPVLDGHRLKPFQGLEEGLRALG